MVFITQDCKLCSVLIRCCDTWHLFQVNKFLVSVSERRQAEQGQVKSASEVTAYAMDVFQQLVEKEEAPSSRYE